LAENNTGNEYTRPNMNFGFLLFRPKLIESLKNYSTQTFFADLTAGLTVGIVA